ncbi:MAG: Fur family transcriptional regulator [Nitrospirota bacterium]
MKREIEIFKNHISRNKLKLTKQRDIILDAFLKTESHVSAEELYKDISKSNPTIGLATIYRALHLFCQCGLAQKRQFGDGQTRFEHFYNHTHHDHLVCTRCGKISEFENPEIEKIQEYVAKRNNFLVYNHRLEMYGLCRKCKKLQLS